MGLKFASNEHCTNLLILSTCCLFAHEI